ncbi:hypothetical protein A8E25_14825 [Burkholderia cenocepacia]|nr:hypothetical protein A8D61_36180 [Burkholderia cenocepacia]EPZ85061.1 hypothetical protein BURCENK562V_C7292 [Burkholderia cenocepacia K56-2Valvano]ERI28077.1 hypothetical protein BURCENBC7_AP2119 [Burkholderia cenocepacia BC7]AQQ45107.1 hypothetical protein A8F32_04520 [Burkholderia cenocepacia]ONJ10940.1 hypothetical protein A8D82_34200 [Burkholderia cenocepacia]
MQVTRTACASFRSRRSASYSPQRRTRFTHFVILTILCGERRIARAIRHPLDWNDRGATT